MPVFVATYFMHASVWIVAVAAALIILMLSIIAALPIKRKITPHQWANELEKHLLGTEGHHAWDDATSVCPADERLERLRYRLVPYFDLLTTPEKQEEFRRIIEALRRGEVP
jgi:uncharacterized membrane protein YagU involved in acid resistance